MPLPVEEEAISPPKETLVSMRDKDRPWNFIVRHYSTPCAGMSTTLCPQLCNIFLVSSIFEHNLGETNNKFIHYFIY